MAADKKLNQTLSPIYSKLIRKAERVESRAFINQIQFNHRSLSTNRRSKSIPIVEE